MQKTAGPSNILRLSPRERDCLALLREGLYTRQVASKLGIAMSTLNKHLASVRAKLGVHRTSQALLFCQEEARQTASTSEGDHGAGLDDFAEIAGFADDLDGCATFDETWAMMRTYTARFGITGWVCGVVAEPPGQLTNGACAVAMSHPKEVLEMYHQMGGEAADPTVPYTVHNTESLLIDNERLLRGLRHMLPKPVAELGDALIDYEMRFQLHQPGRDDLTQAPLLTAFVIEPGSVADFRGRTSHLRKMLRAMSSAFWRHLQENRLLAAIPGLTPRQVEALTFAARGFTVHETAEQMGVSARSAEKTLAAARKRLGARTTPAAVYRALVYRTIV